MGLFGGRTLKDDSSARAAQQALVQSVVFRVMPAEFRTNGQLTRTILSPEIPVALIAETPRVPPPSTPATVAPPKPASVGVLANIQHRLRMMPRMMYVWIGIAVIVIGGLVGVLLLLPSPQPTPARVVADVTVPVEDVAVDKEATPVSEQPVVEPKKQSAADGDGDGLSDTEEIIYASNPALFDTDGDGYSDQLEVLNLYNPAGIAPVRLVESGAVKTYANTVMEYTILYPTAWQLKSGVETGRDVSFAAEDGTVVRVTVQDNPQQLSAATWVQLQFPLKQNSSFIPIAHDTVEGVWDSDQHTAYVTRSVRTGQRQQIVVIQYVEGQGAGETFLSTMRMMVQSVEWKG